MNLTVRENQVAELISWGLSEKEIASKLFLSNDTVKTHKKNLMRKIQAHNIADVTRWFFSRTHGIRFNKSQFARQIIAILFLSLSIGDIAGGDDMLRIFRARRPGKRIETTIRSRRRND